VSIKITRVSVYQKNLPLESPYWLSGGRLKFEVLDATFIKIVEGHLELELWTDIQLYDKNWHNYNFASNSI